MSAPPLAHARNAGIDWLRGLAILLVIVHHLALPFRLPLRPSLLGNWWPKRLLDAISFNGYEAVFVFFVISGFLITTRILERDADLARVRLRDLVPASDEVWREKAYLPGMAAIAWGVLAALLARRWRPALREARLLAVFGAVCILLVLGWGDLVHRHLHKSGMACLCVGAGALLLAFRAHPPAPVRALAWLARMGALSYELYLSHMFVVLAAVGAYRALRGHNQDWNFVVYLPVLVVCFALAGRLERLTARLRARWPAVNAPRTRE